MAVQRKRKHASAEETAAQQAPSAQHSIASFGTIGKARDASEGLKKRKMMHHAEQPIPTRDMQPAQSQNKRKRDLEESNIVDSGVATCTSKQRSAGDICTPRNKRFKDLQRPSPAATPSKCAADLFSNMKLDKPQSIPFALSTEAGCYDTPPMTPESHMDDSRQLPPELDDLVLLHSSFLSALSMYYAHNGTSSPADMKSLLPMITKHWKKRTVSVDDLRVLLGVNLRDEPDFQLKDFGRAGIRLVKTTNRGRAAQRPASYIDEIDLSSRFESALQSRWSKWLAVAPKDGRSASIFWDQLPLAGIEKDASVENAAPMFARGQQRLTDLKASQVAATKEIGSIITPSSEQKSATAVLNRGTSLLDRILAKQALSSTLPAGPTRDQLERKAALQRTEDIARVLELLSTGRSRCSFSMQAVAQQLRQSLRNPISKEEIERCLELMANEVTPGFVSLICNGAVTGIIVTRSGRVSSEELRRRVQVALES